VFIVAAVVVPESATVGPVGPVEAPITVAPTGLAISG
jgi:hypothetical protein